MSKAPKVRTSHRRNKEEAARLQKLVNEKYASVQSCSSGTDWTSGVKQLLDAIDYTLTVHGKIDADTPLHDRVRKFWSAEGMQPPGASSPTPQAQAGDTDFDEYPYDDERFNRGVQHVVDLLANTIAAPDTWHSGDGSEDYDEDLAETLRNILAARGLYDKDTGEFGGVAQAVPQRDEMVARALARIAAANFSDPETDDLTVPLAIELAEVQARLSYMEGKYGAIDWNTAVSSTEGK